MEWQAEIPVTNRDDRRLLVNVRAGRADACAALVRDHYKTIYRFLVHMLRDVHRAEDLTQETFVTAWEHIATFQGRSTLATWLHRIAYTKFVDSQRAERRGANMLERLTSSTPPPVDPLESAMAVDEARRLQRAVNELEPAERAAIVLHYFQGLSYREMAAVVGEPTGTVKWRTREALNRLRILLGEGSSDHDIAKTADFGSNSRIAGSTTSCPARAARFQ
jgi:RNA polymerase sigma-70 factor (ECF subfamily)